MSEIEYARKHSPHLVSSVKNKLERSIFKKLNTNCISEIVGDKSLYGNMLLLR